VTGFQLECSVKDVESGVELFTSILSHTCKPGNCRQRNKAHRWLICSR